MEAQKYLRVAIVGVIFLVLLTVGYGIYINDASREHIKKMEEARYTVLPVAHAKFQDIHSQAENLNVHVQAYWTVDVTAQYDGVISAVHYQQGQHVNAGDVLAELRNIDLTASLAAAEASIEEVRARLINAEQNVRRYQYLLANEGISRQEYDGAVAQRDAYKAQLERTIAQRDLVYSEESKMVIKAPQEASIVQVYQEKGKFVRAGEAVFLLADLKCLRMEASISREQMRSLLTTGKDFLLQVKAYSLTNKAYPYDEGRQSKTLPHNQFKITLEKTIPDTAEDSEYYKTFWILDNEAGIMDPTYYGNAVISAQNVVSALVVPKYGVHFDPDTKKHFVYTLNEEQVLVRRDVGIGIEGDGVIQITDGIAEGEPVVIANPAEYSVGMRVGVKEYEF